MELNTILITQARKGSTRLPGKVLKKIQGRELLLIHLDRLRNCKFVDKIIVATTTETADLEIADLVSHRGYECFRGSESDVLDRFYQTIKLSLYTCNWVVRVTSDCPLIDGQLVDAVISFAQTNDLDYCSNVIIEHFPDGQDVEVFKFSALEKAWNETTLQSDREHVTPYIRNNSTAKGKDLFQSMNFPCRANFNEIRMTVDEEKDYLLIKKIVEQTGTEKTWLEYAQFILNNNLYKLNNNIIRNEGYSKSLSND